MKSKNIILFITFISIIVIALMMYTNRQKLFTNNSQAGLLWFLRNSYPTPAFSTQAQQPKIYINGVAVNNFYPQAGMKVQAEPSAENDSISIDSSEYYAIFYIPDPNLFYINIFGSPFQVYRVKAEEALMNKLGITGSQACKLHVEIVTSPAFNLEEAGYAYSLSICGESPRNLAL